jgi:hypothetical protein
MIFKPAEVAVMLQKRNIWGVHYDPGTIISRRRITPFTRYWTLLKNRIGSLDIHDYVSGVGPKWPGHGQAQLDITVNDAIISGFKGWYCLKPGMGRRYGTMSSRTEIFEHAFKLFKEMFNRLGLDNLIVQKQTKYQK